MTERDGPRLHGRAAEPLLFIDHWYGRATLLALSIALLTFSFAGPTLHTPLGDVSPFGSFFLAYVGLVPWLIVLRRMRSQRAAFLWFWGAGIVFFLANMWWLVYVTAPGMVALMVMLGTYWGIAAVVIRGTRLLDPYWRAAPPDAMMEPAEPRPSTLRVTLSVLLIPAVWAGLEWVRGNYPLNGLPWLFLGHTQSPTLTFCQVADVAGVYGISYWVMAINVVIALAIIHRHRLRRVGPAGLIVALMTLGVAGYGVFRLTQQTTEPGPSVTVVQPSYPQSNSGEKGADLTEIIDFHINATDRELARVGRGKSDLIVWSETMMPPMNPESREGYEGTRAGLFFDQTLARIGQLASTHNTAILAGGTFEADWQVKVDRVYPANRRNVAYFFHPTGILSPRRYDKVHIVPFGEYLPGKDIVPPLYELFVWLSPYPTEYFLKPGSEDQLTVFEIAPRGAQGGGDGVQWRFVTPICFEDIDPALVSKMFRGTGAAAGTKRADFIVNITNDGWFKGSEMPQHLQCAIFRSIENRAPTARSVNTGISGYIDSTGRTFDLIPVGTEGARTATLKLDRRYTFYTRFGDVFAMTCAGGTAIMAVVALVRWWGRRGERRAAKIVKTRLTNSRA